MYLPITSQIACQVDSVLDCMWGTSGYMFAYGCPGDIFEIRVI